MTLALCLAGASVPTRAITDEDIYAGLRFPTAPPGARAAAMGGAQTADVAGVTASWTNPARLAALEFPELTGDFRSVEIDGASRASGIIPFDPGINPYAGSSLSGTESFDSSALPAFIGYAHPLDLMRPVVVSIARVELMDVSLKSSSENVTVPLSAPVTPIGGDEVRRISVGQGDLSVTGFQAAAGWRLTPTFSVGGALLLGKLDLSTSTTGYLSDPLQFTGVGMIDPRFGGPTAEPLASTRSSGSDTDLAFTLGTAWKPRPSLTLATVYRRGPEFTIDARTYDYVTSTAGSFDNVLKIPDVATVGISWEPFMDHPSTDLRTLRIAVDVQRVEYQDLLQGFRSGQNVLTRPDFVRAARFEADDATEIRLGAEVQVSMLTWTLSLRGGAYTDHGGGVRFAGSSGDVGALSGQAAALGEGGFFEDRDTKMHGTLGAGASFYTFSIDVALDYSEPTTAVSLSASYRFR